MDKRKGYLVAIGGAENKGDNEKTEQEENFLNSFEGGILSKILQLIEKEQEPMVEVITTASSVPEEMAQIYKDAFGKLRCNNIGHLNICTRKEAKKTEY